MVEALPPMLRWGLLAYIAISLTISALLMLHPGVRDRIKEKHPTFIDQMIFFFTVPARFMLALLRDQNRT